MAHNKITPTIVGADLSAFGGFHNNPSYFVKSHYWPSCMFRYTVHIVKLLYMAVCRFLPFHRWIAVAQNTLKELE